MIQKVDIKKFGVFENYLWDTSIGKSETFRKLNILYGRNYSGKTTLARIFKCIEDQRLHANYLDCDFSVLLTSGKTITPRNLSDFGIDRKIRIYNTDFVKDNLAWLRNEDGTIKPFTVLGAKNIELEKRISDILEAISSIETKKGLQFDISEKIASCQRSKKRYDDLDSGLENKLSIKAKSIKTNTAIYNTPVYSITHLRTDIAKATSQSIPSDSQTDDKKKLLKEEPKEVITRLPETRPTFHLIIHKPQIYYNVKLGRISQLLI